MQARPNLHQRRIRKSLKKLGLKVLKEPTLPVDLAIMELILVCFCGLRLGEHVLHTAR